MRPYPLSLMVLLSACTTPNSEIVPRDGASDRLAHEGLSGDTFTPLREGGAADGPSLDGRRLDQKPGADLGPLTCVPNAFLGCKTSSQLLQCNASGTGTVVVSCSPYQCDAINKRCSQCDPKTPPVCQGNDLVTCTAEGLLVKTTCPSGCVNGSCVGCTPKSYYKDGDGDGFGSPASKLDACAQPVGYVANDLDCDDLDPAAHPGQTAFFNVPTKGAGNYDYNCDKVEEKESPVLVACVVSGMTCVGDGWAATVPACGTAGVWTKCTKGSGRSGCGTTTSTQIQSCH